MPKPENQMKLHIAVITTYPPGKGSLNEYAYHFIRSLRKKEEVTKLTLLTDELPAGESYPAAHQETHSAADSDSDEPNVW